MSDEQVSVAANIVLSPDQMFGIRGAALSAAARLPGLTAPIDVLKTAQLYLAFMLNGMPPAKAAPAAAAPSVPASSAATTPAPAAGKPKKAAPTAAAQPSLPAQSAATGAATPALTPAPVTLIEAANSLKALVQTQPSTTANEAGAGRKAAIALLTKYSVREMAQIPPAQLAAFKKDCDDAKAQIDGAGQAATPGPIDPLAGLMG
jgi:hypothetical protein